MNILNTVYSIDIYKLVGCGAVADFNPVH